MFRMIHLTALVVVCCTSLGAQPHFFPTRPVRAPVAICAGRGCSPLNSGADYEVVELELERGDRIVFCSDGIVEAGDEEGEISGFESAEDAIRLGCLEDLSAAELAAQLMAKVDAFSGAEPQGDDQTVVVLRVE